MPLRRTPTTLADIIAAAEAAKLAELRESMAEAVELEARIALLTVELESAAELHEQFLTDVKVGEVSYDGDEDRRLQDAINAAEIQLDGARSRLAKLTRKPVATNAELAEIVAPAVRAALPGVPVHTTFLPPPVPAAADLPVAFAVALEDPTGPPDAEHLFGDGYVGGRVEVLYFREVIHRTLRQRDLGRAAEKLDLPVRVTSRSLEGSDHDRLILNIEGAVPEVPVVTKYRPDAASGVARRFGIALSGSRGTHQYLHDSRATVTACAVEDGLRRVEIEATATLRTPRHPGAASVSGGYGSYGIINGSDSTVARMDDGERKRRPVDDRTANEVTASLVGQMFANIGRVVEARLVSERPATEESDTIFTARLVIESRDGYSI